MTHHEDLSALFRRWVLLASALPAAGCGSTIVTSDAAPQDTPPADAPVADTAPDRPLVGRPDCRVIQRGAMMPCEFLVETPCTTDPNAVTQAGFCQSVCTTDAGFFGGCSSRGTGVSGGLVIACTTCAIGRRPDGLCLMEHRPGTPLGQYFARVAALEAASVPAFELLAEELWADGAPSSLVMRCLSAADDERRHAVVMGRIAREFGASPGGFTITDRARRGAREVALQNAREGCVREAFGALLATWQASHARHGAVRDAMGVIADDETRHATLSFDIAAWFERTLDDDAREATRAAREEALQSLRAELDARVPTDLGREAGVPSPDVAIALWTEFARALHADALAA